MQAQNDFKQGASGLWIKVRCHFISYDQAGTVNQGVGYGELLQHTRGKSVDGAVAGVLQANQIQNVQRPRFGNTKYPAGTLQIILSFLVGRKERFFMNNAYQRAYVWVIPRVLTENLHFSAVGFEET